MRLIDTSFIYSNPGTTQDLVVPVNLVPGVTVEVMKENAEINQKWQIPWVDTCEPHDGAAIICGAGPSLADTLDELRSLKGDIFASNSAAGYLMDQGFEVEYQTMLDPHPMLSLDFAPAKKHLLASIVDTNLFCMAQNPILWHPNTSWIDECIKPDCPPFTFIGGGVTVSNSAMCIAYTMGYREFHVFGMDSSHRDDKSHVREVQSLEPLACTVTENGTDYKTSFDMKAQAVVFMEIHKLLTDAGCSVKVYGSGLLPDMYKAN